MSFDPKSKRIQGRQKLIEYRKAMWAKRKWDSERPMGSGEMNRNGNPKLPPGQHESKNWPVLDLGVHPELDEVTWNLTISGLVKHPQMFTWDQFMELPQVEDVSDFHCVTSWSQMDNHWKGVRFRDIAARCEPLGNAKFVYIKAFDAYSTNLPLEEAMKEDVLLVHHWEGHPLTRDHGGPVRMITPQLYAWKGAKWIGEIVFREHDELGFWEKRGYSNTAEPWLNDRYS